MLSQIQAREIALNKLKEWNFEDGDEIVLLDEDTREEDFGWIFSYQSKIYLETGIFSYCLVGNAPLIVDRYDGSLHFTGTAYPLEHYIEEYRKTLSKND